MTTSKILLGLLGSSALCLAAAPAFAQEAAPAADAAEAPMTAEEAAAQNAFLAAQIDAMQAQIDALKKQVGKAEPSWKGAPQWADSSAGWTFKLRGRLMYDVAYIDNPGLSYTQQGGSATAADNGDLGFNSRLRRARLGVEGTMPGNFSYKMEVDFANSAVGFADAFVEWKSPKTPWSVRVGHFETFQSLEQITSSRHITFIERAQMNDAFGHARRLGAAIGFDKGDWLIRAGVFNDTVNASLNNDEWLIGARAVYAPKMFGGQMHFGANYQHREFASNAYSARYRARPFLQTTATRFVDTAAYGASSDDVFGLEAAAIFGSLHVAAEGQYVKANIVSAAYVAGDKIIAATRLADEPSFTSFYVEAGYWLTGETRGYKKGEWDRTKVLNGFDKGGMGAVGINLRYDHLDLADDKLYGAVPTAVTRTRGGKQDGFLASVIWQPIDYVRITAQYAHAEIEGGPFVTTVKSGTGANPENIGYGVDTFGMRFAFDF